MKKIKLAIVGCLGRMGKEVINDYKFFCFNGKPKFVQIDIERGIETMLVIAAVHKSAKEQRSVKINYDKGFNFNSIRLHRVYIVRRYRI